MIRAIGLLLLSSAIAFAGVESVTLDTATKQVKNPTVKFGSGNTLNVTGATLVGFPGGVTAFTDLSDVPSSYVGEGLKAVRVNVAEDGLEFFTISAGGVTSVFGRTGAVTAQSGDYTAAQVTNAADTTSSYANPAWITSLIWSKITSTPTTLAGYGITDAVPSSRTVNGHALSSNVTVTASDVSAVPLTRNINTTAPISGGGALNADLTLSMHVADLSHDGYLSLADWSYFNTGAGEALQWDGGATNLVAATGRTSLGLGTLATQNGTFSGTSSGTNTGDQTITLTSDVTGSGTGSFATTLKTVNSNVGSFTNSNITVNAKGLITAASNGTAGGTIASTTKMLRGDGSGNAIATTLDATDPNSLILQVTDDATLQMEVYNPSTGTNANTSFALQSHDVGAEITQLAENSTPTGLFPAGCFRILSEGPRMVLGAVGDFVFSNDYGVTQNVTINNGLMIGTTTDPGSGWANASNGYKINNVALAKGDVGLGNVTNDAQTKAAIVPNTAPSAGQILVGNAGNTAYAKQTVSGSGATMTMSSAGAITISAIANASLANSAITIGGVSTSLGGSALANVTDDTQTKAAIVPNTAPTSGQVLFGNAGNTAYAKQTVSGSGATITASNSGVFTISGIANASLSNSAITIAGTSTSLGGSITQDTITGLTDGIAAHTATNTLTPRTITGTANQVSVSNGNGVSGNPTLSVPSSAQLNIAKITNETTNGLVTVSGGDGTLGVTGAQVGANGTTTSGTAGTTVAHVAAAANTQLVAWTMMASQTSAANSQMTITITYSDTTTCTVTSSAASATAFIANAGGVQTVTGAGQQGCSANKLVTDLNIVTAGTGTGTRAAVISAMQIPR